MQLLKKTPEIKSNESGYDISIKGIIESAPNTVPIGIAIAINRTFFFVNDFYCDILEYSREELIGKSTRIIYPTDENYEFVGKEIQIQLKKYGHGTLETRAITKSGKVKDLIASYSMMDKKDPEKGIVFAIIDITENKKIENALKQSELRYRELYNNMSTCVAIYQANDQGNDFVIRGINTAGEKKSKVKLEEIKGKNVSEVFPSVKEIGLFDVFKRVYATGKPEYLPTRFYKDSRISEWVENYVYKLPSGEIVALYDDISERKIAEDLLRDSEKRYRLLFESVQVGVILQSINGKILHANKIASEIFALPKEDILEKTSIDPIWNMILEDGTPVKGEDHPSMITIQTGKPLKDQIRGIYGNDPKKMRWLKINTQPIIDEKTNTFKEVLITFDDITDLKKSQNEIKESQQKFMSIFDNANDPILIFNKKDQLIDANKKASKVFGYSKEELLKMTVSDFQAPEVRGKPGTVIKSELEKYGEGEIFETLDIDKFGNIFPIEISQTLITIRGEEVVLNIVRDITERKIAEELLKKSEEKYRRIVDTSNEGIWIIDDHYITTFANSKMSEMLRYTTKEMIGKSAGIFLYDNDINPQVNRMAARTEGLSQNYELALRKKNGEKLWALVSATPILDDQGNFKGSFAMFTDITERKQNEEVIKQLNDNLKLLNKILRHDIANHLTVVSLSLEMIETNNQDIKNKAFNSIKRSVDLIEKLRALESTMITKYDLKPVVVGQIAEFVKKSYANVTIDLIEDCTVMADEALTSVIDNIINNAITHSKTDKIDIKITSEKDICKIKITDYGIGIPDSIKRQIFDEEFSYGETRGTGLGLFIAKKNIERYGGEIEVKDTKPHGATFILKLKKCKI